LPVVTRITTQKNSAERFNIFWEKGHGEEYGFSVDQDVLIQYQIKKGTSLGERELNEILQFDSYKKGLNKAIQFLSYRMRSEYEVMAYLRKNEYIDEVCKDIINKLREYSYIDDLEFAKMFVRNRIQFSTKGPGVIEQELFQKGVGKNIINSALTEYTFELQVDKAANYVEKRLNKKKKDSSVQIKQKLGNSLTGKGFGWDVVQVVMTSLEINQNHDEEREALQHHAKKSHRKYKKYKEEDKQKYRYKMKQALYQKGFPIALIDQWLNEETTLE
jgi:regulatory protein